MRETEAQRKQRNLLRKNRRADWTEEQWDKQRAWQRAYQRRLRLRKARENDLVWYRRQRAYDHKARGLPTPTRPEPKKCELCGSPPQKRVLDLDHDHANNTFRGWLCGRCNSGLGFFKDSPVILRKAIKYLEIRSATNR